METVTKNKLQTEQTFEMAIVSHLSSNGWTEGSAVNLSRELCLDEKAVLEFLQTSQTKEWETFFQFYKGDAETQIIKRLVKEIDLKGMLEVVRHGITDGE